MLLEYAIVFVVEAVIAFALSVEFGGQWILVENERRYVGVLFEPYIFSRR